MKRFHIFSLLVIPLLLLSFSISASYAETYYYATTDMTFAEFYAGEIGDPPDTLAVSYDAVSTATQRFITRFAGHTAITSGDGSVFTGIKAVQVRMTQDVYNSLSSDSRYTFVTESFDEYKDVDSDGTFGEMQTELITADGVTVSFAGGASNTHGNYRLNISGLSYDQLGADLGTSNDKFLGAKLTTSDGTVYGLKPLHNLWIRGNLAEQIGFCIQDFTERNGTHLSYAHTAGLPGKTITEITYMLKNQPDIVIECEVFVKKWTDAAITVSGDVKSGSNITVHFTSSDIPSDSAYELASVAKVAGRSSTALTSTDYTYSDGVLTFTSVEAGSYTATFSDSSYADITANITVNDYYAVTDMTWAEFYAGEIVNTSADLLDAVSSPTARVAYRFTQLVSESNDLGGRDITGVKDVQVRMTGAVYEALTDKSRYIFSDDVFSEYKLVSPDGSFGAMITETTTASSADVTLSSGASAVWGNYVLKITSADVTLGSGDTRYYLGALITTSDGKVYGMRHNNNLWFSAGDMALAVQEFVEVHGVSRKYEYTSDMTGKTITKIQYMLKNLPDVVVSCDVYLPPLSLSASANKTSVDITAGIGASLDITITGLADGESCDIVSLIYGTGRGRQTISTEYYSYSDGVLTLSDDLSAGQYTAIFRNEKYADVSVSFAVTGMYHFATTDMSYAEFYFGEIGEFATTSLDAVSSATTGKAARFGVLNYEIVSDDNGNNITKIYGLADVQVRMTDEVYALLSKDSRYTFSTTAFSEYKEVSTDKTFGKMVTDLKEVEGASVSLSSGASTVWGNYWLNLSGVDSVDVSGKYLGAVLETSDGKKYPMQHLYNLFFKNNEMAFCIQDFTEPHGNTPAYAHTNDLVGKTITKITYLLKDTADMYVSCDVYVPVMSSVTVSLSNDEVISGTNVAIPLKFSGSPEGSAYSVTSLYSGSGRSRTPITSYTFSDNTLTISGDIAPGNYTAVFHTEGYTDIALTFRVEGYHYATTNMTWAEFYAGETGTTSADLRNAGLDAVSSSTKRIAGRFTQLVSTDNDLGGADITGVRAVQVRMNEDVYKLLSSDSRYTFVDTEFTEYKIVSADGSFGEMLTDYEDADGAVVTLRSGANSTWGNYMLMISSADIALTSGDERLDLGALITTSGGQVYGLRHNSNLWFSAGEIALTYEEFIEPHGISRDYDYTSDIQGKTITKIQYMLKNKPDVVISCDVYLKLKSAASVSYAYPEGYNGILVGTGDPVTITFRNCSSDAAYDIDSVTPSIRHAAALDSSLYEYSDRKLTFAPTVVAGRYKAVFSTEKYSDLAATVEVFTTDSTSLIISNDKNGAALNFLLTPKGYIDAVDVELNKNKFANASDYTTIAENSTAPYTEGSNEVSGSGFTFDIVLNGVSPDYTGIVGFSKVVNMTSATLGTALYQKVYTVFNALPKFYEEWRGPSEEDFRNAGLRIILVQSDGVSRDVTGLAGGGVIINSDGSIMLNYGAMAADSSTITEGTYTLSPEGETLLKDGVRDGRITLTMYIEGTASGSASSTESSDQPAPAPESGDVHPAPDDVPHSSEDVPPAPDDGETYSAVPGTPAVSVQDSAVVQTIIDALSSGSSAVTSTTEVALLPENAAGGRRGIDAVSAEELAAIPSNESIALILPLMSVDKEAVYVFGVDLSSLEAGAYIVLHMTAEAKTANTAAFYSSAENNVYTFLDDDGNETEIVPENKHVNIAAYMEPEYTYSPIITTKSSSSGDDSGTDTDTDTIANDPGSPGGGCDSGFSFVVLAVLGLLAKKHLVK